LPVGGNAVGAGNGRAGGHSCMGGLVGVKGKADFPALGIGRRVQQNHALVLEVATDPLQVIVGPGGHEFLRQCLIQLPPVAALVAASRQIGGGFREDGQQASLLQPQGGCQGGGDAQGLFGYQG